MQKPFSRFLKKGKKRIKAAKVDFAELIRDESRRFIENLLLAKRTLKRGYFNEEFIRRIVDEHMRGEKNHTTKLSHLVTFELWNRVFIDGAEL